MSSFTVAAVFDWGAMVVGMVEVSGKDVVGVGDRLPRAREAAADRG